MDNRMRRELDHYMTGHYGEDQFDDNSEDDPTNDGPEVEVIAHVRESHPAIATAYDLLFSGTATKNSYLFKSYEARRTRGVVMHRRFWPTGD